MCDNFRIILCCRRRLSRLDVYRVDTYSRVVGRSRAEVTGSRVGRSTSADYGLWLARAGGGGPATSRRSQTSQPDGRSRGGGGGRQYTPPRPQSFRTPRNNQSQSHWAYFRSVDKIEHLQRQVNTTDIQIKLEDCKICKAESLFSQDGGHLGLLFFKSLLNTFANFMQNINTSLQMVHNKLHKTLCKFTTLS